MTSKMSEISQISLVVSQAICTQTSWGNFALGDFWLFRQPSFPQLFFLINGPNVEYTS